MSENIQEQSVNQEVCENNQSLSDDELKDNIVNNSQNVDESLISNHNVTDDDKQSYDNLAQSIVNQMLINQMNAYKTNEENNKYLSENLAKYDSENYLQNQSFKELYAEAFSALGTNLDTDKFVKLLDNYVESRILAHSKKLAASKENDKLTDSFSYQKGQSKKAEKSLRMQDIPDDQLEKYIAKYI